MDFTKKLARKELLLLWISLPYNIGQVVIFYCLVNVRVLLPLVISWGFIVTLALPFSLTNLCCDCCWRCWSKCVSQQRKQKIKRFLTWYLTTLFVELSIAGLIISLILLATLLPESFSFQGFAAWQIPFLVLFYVAEFITIAWYFAYLWASKKEQ